MLTDGRKVEFEGKGYIDYKFNPNIGTLLYLQGQGTYTLSELPSTGDFIPPTYGVKRLGIADYRKVEQEICCYVPGEVSHIENIMASEYKERSTRALQRREETNTFSKETETEKLTDTSTSNRFEMNQEVNNVLAESSSNNTHIGGDVRYSPMQDMQIGVNASADFATNTTKEESNHQAVTSAKEVTERALDRIVQKVKEERVVKITNEFEETNKHGFNNEKNPNHISGVYRWVDKVYRNTVVNYGKRLMYEFMVPEPAAFHNLAATISTGSGEKLVKPIDPRNGNGKDALKSPKDLLQTNYVYWASQYEAQVETYPDNIIYLNKAFSGNSDFNMNQSSGNLSGKESKEIIDLQIPDGYETQNVKISSKYFFDDTNRNYHGYGFSVGNIVFLNPSKNIDVDTERNLEYKLDKFTNKIGVGYQSLANTGFNISFSIKCILSESGLAEWQIKTFNAIMAAYEQKLADYNQKLKQLKGEIKGTNPGFYRQIENTVLRKNCIEYLNSHNLTGINPGKELITGTNAVPDFKVKYDAPELEAYAARVKFFEQAFEWNNMSYNFYPMYWGEKAKLQQKYNVDEYNDPIFRAFLQSGMARVIVTVRPGFEEAVNWYMATGQIWNGGQVPTIDDPLYVSIVEELREIDGDVEETWETRVPTSLTILQAGSAGLDVKHALPCDEDCKENTLFDSDGNAIGKENPFVLRPIEIITPVRPIGDLANTETTSKM